MSQQTKADAKWMVEAEIRSLEYDMTSRQKRLRSNLEHLQDKVARQIERLDADGSIENSLGVCQGTASEIDRLCGEIAMLSEALGRLKRVAGQVAVLAAE